jgi:hypothetical protein
MRIKGIAGEFGDTFDIFDRNRSTAGENGVTQFRLR